MTLGPRQRWAATALVWAIAPLAGLALINLPPLVQLQAGGADLGAPLGAIIIGLFVLLVAWSTGAWIGAQLHKGRAKAIHVAGCALAACMGLLYPQILSLFDTVRYGA